VGKEGWWETIGLRLELILLVLTGVGEGYDEDFPKNLQIHWVSLMDK
jgi:hypothetical protein